MTENPTPVATKRDDITSAEVAMHIFRLVRSGKYHAASQIVEATQEAFPDVDKTVITKAMRELATKLIAIQA